MKMSRGENPIVDIIATITLLLLTTVAVTCYLMGTVDIEHLARFMASECLLILIYFSR